MIAADKPVIMMGHGIRASGADPSPLLELDIPVLSSWQGADLVDNYHPMYFGRTGIYGQRCANKILFEADHIISIGSRLCAWQIGHGGLRPEQKVTMVDVDGKEVSKIPNANHVNDDAKTYIEHLPKIRSTLRTLWVDQCFKWKHEFPWVEYPAHEDTNGYINSYRFVQKLELLLRPDEVIVSDNGSLMCPLFQALHLKPPQRLMTAGCLGEMGCALPGAVGASFARGNGEVLAFIGDGGMMMNLQELATIQHHKLPIKMIVFENDGYSMIKGTYTNQKLPRKGVDAMSGLSLPDFCKVARAFEIPTIDVRTWDEVERFLPVLFACNGPFLMQVHLDPEQAYVPRLQPIIKDGKITPARFDELSPRI